MGERSQREAGRGTIVSDLVTCSDPALWDPVCFTDQQTQSLLSSPIPVTQTGCVAPYTHVHTHTHSNTHTQHHTPSHTPHTLHKHTYSSHPHTHILFTHTHTLTYSHPHTLLTHSYTYSSYPHKHTPSHTPYFHTHTHTRTHVQSLQEYRHRKHGDPGAVFTHQARGVCGNSPESSLGSVAGPFTHWEPLGLLEAP